MLTTKSYTPCSCLAPSSRNLHTVSVYWMGGCEQVSCGGLLLLATWTSAFCVMLQWPLADSCWNGALR